MSDSYSRFGYFLSGRLSFFITNFGHIRWLTIENVDIFCPDTSGFHVLKIMNFGYVGQLAVEDVDVLDKQYLNKIECKYCINFMRVGCSASM